MMTSSCSRPTSPSLAASALGETRMVSSWTSVPRCAWAAASDVTARTMAASKVSRRFISMIIGRNDVACNVSHVAKFLQHLGLDVAAGNDCHVQFCFRQLFGVEEKAGGCDCATGLGDGIGICGQQTHRLVDFVFADGDDGVDKTLHVFEVDVADALRAPSVGD